MLTLKILTLKGIGRFVTEQKIFFDKFGNLIQVDGQNNNTGGSSGAAKSTIFNGLEFLFGLNSIPNTVLQSRLTEEPMFVEGEFDFDGLPLTISRGKKLKITINGEVTTGSSKLSEEKLDQIISIPRHLFRPMLHKRQKEPGFFLNFTPKETNDFLIDCLDLGHYKKYLLDLETKLSNSTNETNLMLSNLESAKAGLEASKNAQTALGSAPAKEMGPEDVLILKIKADASREQLNRLQIIQKTEMSVLELNRPKLISIPFDTSLLEEYDNRIKNLRNEAHSLALKEKERQSLIKDAISVLKFKQSELHSKIQKGTIAKEEATQTASEIKKIRENLCFTCEQTWITDKAKNKEVQLLEKLKALKAVMLEGTEANVEFLANPSKIEALSTEASPKIPEGLAVLASKEKELLDLQSIEKVKEKEHNAQQNQNNIDKQNEFLQAQKAIGEKYVQKIEQLNGQVNLDTKLFEASEMKVRAYNDAIFRYNNGLKTLKDQEQTYQEKVDTISVSLVKLKQKIELIEELKRAVKSFLSCSFDEALDIISENATKLARNVPNMANCTIQLMGTRETKDGKIKEEVTAVLHLDGDENIDIRSLSGGERSAIDLAVDLSVIELIEDKTNKGINMFILDEPFTGLDSVSVEMALEVLKGSNPNKKIIVVDHNPIVKESISDRITVIRNKETSHIEC